MFQRTKILLTNNIIYVTIVKLSFVDYVNLFSKRPFDIITKYYTRLKQFSRFF